MKIEFGDKSYLDIKRNWNNKKISIIISSKSSEGKINITSCQITDEQFKELINSIDKEDDFDT